MPSLTSNVAKISNISSYNMLWNQPYTVHLGVCENRKNPESPYNPKFQIPIKTITSSSFDDGSELITARGDKFLSSLEKH